MRCASTRSRMSGWWMKAPARCRRSSPWRPGQDGDGPQARSDRLVGGISRARREGHQSPSQRRHGHLQPPHRYRLGPGRQIYISDGYGNSRVVKISQGRRLAESGRHLWQRRRPDSTRRTASRWVRRHVYVADRNNSRIQVYDMDLNFQKYITGIGQPWSVQVTPKYIYSGDGDGKIYRMDHDGKMLGWVQTELGQGQTGCLIHSLYARWATTCSTRAPARCGTWRRSRSRSEEWSAALQRG